MKRHLLAGRFGPDDQIDIPSAADEQVTRLELVAGERSLDHGIGDALASLKRMGVFPSEIGFDLLIVATCSCRRHANLTSRTIARLMDA